MKFFAFGINYQTAPVAVREAFALPAELTRSVYQSATVSAEAEFIFLSTCNRTEIYLYGSEADVEVLKESVAAMAGRAWPEGQDFFVEDESMVRHVLYVTAGLKSQVLGDAQILNQVKEAYRIAADEDAIGAVMHRLMHTAFRAAKQVVTGTSVSQGNATVSSLAITAARDILGKGTLEGLRGRKVLLIGAGETGLLALRAIRHYGPAKLWICNRAPRRAQIAAEKSGATAIPWDARFAAVAEADLVIVASGADTYVLLADSVPVRNENSALIIDIAMPRNVDPAIATIPGYRVVDLDGLRQWQCDLEETRRADVPRAEAICQEGLADFVSWAFNHEALRPAIGTLRETFDAIRRQEIERHAKKFNETDSRELDRLTRSIMQKLLSIPIVRMKEAALDGLNLSERIELLNALFSRPGCEDDTPNIEAGTSQQSDPLSCPLDTGDNAVEEVRRRKAEIAKKLPQDR